MSSDLIVGLELSLILGASLGWGFWELWRLRRGRKSEEHPERSDSEVK